MVHGLQFYLFYFFLWGWGEGGGLAVQHVCLAVNTFALDPRNNVLMHLRCMFTESKRHKSVCSE